MKIFDISLPIKTDMPVWPGDHPVDLTQVSSVDHGDVANVTQIRMSVHTGTHIDAPRHFIDAGRTIDQIPLSKLVGEVFVMNIDTGVDLITAEVLMKHPQRNALEGARKVLFKTKNSMLWHSHPRDFYHNYVGLDPTAAAYLSQLKLELIGIDYLSIAPFDDTHHPHHILLSEEIVLLEGVNLGDVPGGIYELYCLPLMIADCDGAPARVILIKA